MMTPKEVRQEWVKALRSGDYQQGVGKLRSLDDKYCCLGVLCELAVKSDVTFVEPAIDCYRYGEEKQIAALPAEVLEWAGIRESLGYYNETGLARLNDTGESFTIIADIIEAEPEGLCV